MTGSAHDAWAFEHTAAAKYPDWFSLVTSLHGLILPMLSTCTPSLFTKNQQHFYLKISSSIMQ